MPFWVLIGVRLSPLSVDVFGIVIGFVGVVVFVAILVVVLAVVFAVVIAGGLLFSDCEYSGLLASSGLAPGVGRAPIQFKGWL